MATAAVVGTVILAYNSSRLSTKPDSARTTVFLLEEEPSGGQLERLKSLLDECQSGKKFTCEMTARVVPFSAYLAPVENIAKVIQAAGVASPAIAGVSGETAAEISKRLPVVSVFFDSYHDPRRYCLVNSLERPAKNATGVFGVPEVGDQMIHAIKKAYPHLKEVIVLVDSERLGQSDCSRGTPDDIYFTGTCRSDWISRREEVDRVIEPSAFFAEATRRQLRLRFFLWCPADSTEILRNLAIGPDTGLVVPIRESFFLRRVDLVRQIRRLGVPAIYQGKTFATNGGLIALKPIMPDAHAVIAAQVRQMVSGRPIEEIPVEQPLLNEIVFNIEEARRLSQKPDKSFLKIVDEFVVTQAAMP